MYTKPDATSWARCCPERLTPESAALVEGRRERRCSRGLPPIIHARSARGSERHERGRRGDLYMVASPEDCAGDSAGRAALNGMPRSLARADQHQWVADLVSAAGFGDGTRGRDRVLGRAGALTRLAASGEAWMGVSGDDRRSLDGNSGMSGLGLEDPHHGHRTEIQGGIHGYRHFGFGAARGD